jgi:hypothetical protein
MEEWVKKNAAGDYPKISKRGCGQHQGDGMGNVNPNTTLYSEVTAVDGHSEVGNTKVTDVLVVSRPLDSVQLEQTFLIIYEAKCFTPYSSTTSMTAGLGVGHYDPATETSKFASF